MLADEALERVRRQRLLGAIERQDVIRRRFRRRIGEFLAIGKNPAELDVGVEVAEQDLRRSGPLERQRRVDEEEDRGEREAEFAFSCTGGNKIAREVGVERGHGFRVRGGGAEADEAVRPNEDGSAARRAGPRRVET